ncbi:spore coat protein CotJB [Anaeromicropila herbilytica]|uniref:Spore coat protein CotJB n=1 Tax=Anaeromicropila herbilytica TaxID=2785025 RepID=A0A7R7EIU5_9FIRM|nr:spore coat protein CotJB [Anaeromicropila herbilytica]BCN29504.1 spore coat protein CotJB [Anaeromicropila herbilytica]
MSEQEKLLYYIHQVCFVLDDIVLYLDTHPTDERALKYYEHYNRIKMEAIHDYSMYFGPLTDDHVNVENNVWEWIVTPFPWEMEA